MEYWEWIVPSHGHMSKDFPAGREGLQAVRFFRSFFEQTECKQLHRNHLPFNEDSEDYACM